MWGLKEIDRTRLKMLQSQQKREQLLNSFLLSFLWENFPLLTQ